MEKNLTILIPTYNRPELLIAAFNSAFRFFGDDVDYIVYDSSDVKNTYFDSQDCLYFFAGKKGGIDLDIEAALSLVKTKYVLILSDDDEVIRPSSDTSFQSSISEHLDNVDFVLLNRNICDLELNLIRRANMFKFPPREFYPSTALNDYLRISNEFACLFTFASSVIFRVDIFRKSNPIEMYNVGYKHVSRFWTYILNNGLKMKFVETPVIMNRSFNDSFLSIGYEKRFYFESELVEKIFKNYPVLFNSSLVLLKRERPFYQLLKVLSIKYRQLLSYTFKFKYRLIFLIFLSFIPFFFVIELLSWLKNTYRNEK